MYWAHRAVVFAIAQLSCNDMSLSTTVNWLWRLKLSTEHANQSGAKREP